MILKNLLRRFSFIVFLVIICLATFAQEARSFSKEKVQLTRDYIEKCRNSWQIPGMAVGIVCKDEIVLSDGFGVKKIGGKDPVDENTLFGIASNTKPFTSVALSILVDQGKISWDDRVVDYLPYFELYDPFVSSNMKIRDLLSHRSGLETFSGDLLWYASSYSREEVVKRAKFLQPVYGFREHYGYSNIMFLAAGLVVEKVTGQKYEEFIKQNIFVPLKMNRSNCSIESQKNDNNVATPHIAKNGEVIPIEYINWDNIAPAGAINSSVSDMLKWMKLMLGKGTVNGKTVFSEERMKEITEANTPKSISSVEELLFPSTHFHAYGLGWDMFDYRGRKVITHSGGLDGMISQTVFIPEDDLAFVILTNSINYLPHALMYKVVDIYLGIESEDFSEFYLNLIKTNEKLDEHEKKYEEEMRIKDPSPCLDLKEYSGTYESKLYGKAEVTLNKGILELQFNPSPDFISELKHWQYNSFVVEFKKFPSLPEGKVNFIVNEFGKVTDMRIDVPNPDFDFTELKFKKIASKE